MKNDIAISDKMILARPAIKVWLLLVAFMVFAMVLVGGATRLTESGLSITEWKPLLGAIPPLSMADWTAAFEKYQQIPEFKLINSTMSLAEFKFIYWWEWSHRFLGRFIGVAFFVPLMFFWLTRRLESRLKPRLLILFILGGLQGALGWYMVMSGLVERTDVSQYRLAAHLSLATLIYAVMIWIALGVGRPQTRRPLLAIEWGAVLLLVLVFLQIAAGGFVAGLDAGMGYNTWPLMDGAVVPDGLLHMQPWWRNMFENAMTVQFQHRMIAYVIFVFAFYHGLRIALGAGGQEARVSGVILVFLVSMQFGLGIAVLLAQVPITLAMAHQGGALLVLAGVVYHLHKLLRQSDTLNSDFDHFS